MTIILFLDEDITNILKYSRGAIKNKSYFGEILQE
jgi:hypothetical protein